MSGPAMAGQEIRHSAAVIAIGREGRDVANVLSRSAV
jgi:hypothetical protein